MHEMYLYIQDVEQMNEVASIIISHLFWIDIAAYVCTNIIWRVLMRNKNNIKVKAWLMVQVFRLDMIIKVFKPKSFWIHRFLQINSFYISLLKSLYQLYIMSLLGWINISDQSFFYKNYFVNLRACFACICL